jgi:hypothetical protein
MIFYLLLAPLILLWLVGWGASLIYLLRTSRAKDAEKIKSARGLFIVLSGIGLVLGLLVRLMFAPLPPSVLYRQVFDEPPSSDVTNIKGEDDGYYDSVLINLSFKASPETIQRLAKKKLLSRVSKTAKGQRVAKAGWWVFDNKHWKDDSLTPPETSLIYDPQSRMAYYSFRDII